MRGARVGAKMQLAAKLQFASVLTKVDNLNRDRLRISFREIRTGRSFLQFLLKISDKILEKLFAFSTAFPRAGGIHNLL